MRRSYVLAGALAGGLAAPTALRFAVEPALLVAALAVLWPRAGLALLLALAGWWWGSERLQALDRSVLAAQIGTAGRALVDLKEPPRRGRYDVRVRAVVVRFAGARVHEPVQLELPSARAPPPQGARLRVLGTLRAPADFERTWLRRHGVHVVLRASTVAGRPAPRRARRPAARLARARLDARSDGRAARGPAKASCSARTAGSRTRSGSASARPASTTCSRSAAAT